MIIYCRLLYDEKSKYVLKEFLQESANCILSNIFYNHNILTARI